MVESREQGEQGQALSDGPRGPTPFPDRSLSSGRRSFRVSLTLELARRPKRGLTEYRQMEAMAGPGTAVERFLESRIPGEGLAMAKD
jgi:hypothetical protein